MNSVTCLSRKPPDNSSCIYTEAARVGATLAELSVERDPNVGVIAMVRAEGDGSALRAALEKFAFRAAFV